MLLDLAMLFKDLRFLLTALLVVVYYFYGAKDLSKLVLVLMLFGLFQKLLFHPLLSLNDARMYWYITWSSLSLMMMYILVKFTQAYPQLQKITIPVSLITLVIIFISMLRHIDRNVLNADVFKKIYSVGIPALNWILTAYLFAPLVLLLVKSIRSRLPTRH